MTAKYGTPYFSNYINSDMEPSDVRSMCCRLRLDLRELRKKSGGFFGSGESTGSVGVVTINLPRIAYLASDEADFYQRLDKIMDLSARSLKIKRDVITKLMEAGLYPYTKRYLGTFDNHFSTIGLIGMNEVGLNAKWLRKDLTHPETQVFAQQVLDHMRERLSDYQEQYGDLYNLEATPAESTTYRLAKHDVERWPDIITAAKPGTPPTTPIPPTCLWATPRTSSPPLAIQDDLQTRYTSGTVFHAFLGRSCPTGRRRRPWCGRSRRTSSCPTTPSLPPTPSARSTATSPGALHLPRLRRPGGGLQPDHRLLPARPELEQRQGPGVQGPEALRHHQLPHRGQAPVRPGGDGGPAAGGPTVRRPYPQPFPR